MKKIIYSFLIIMFSFSILFAQDEKPEKDKKDEKTNKNLPIKPERYFDLKTNEG